MENTKFAMPKKNLMLLAVGFVVIIIGFICMIGGGPTEDNPTGFNPEIFSFRRITLGPIIAILGFTIEAVAILWIPKKKSESEDAVYVEKK